MNLSFYTAAVGAYQQQLRLDVHANNIANVNTYGFRARIPAFSSLMTGEVRAIDQDLNRGVGSKLEDSETDLRPAQLTGTGRVLDFAIEGDGFFMLRDPGTGALSYTRDGSFILSQYASPATASTEDVAEGEESEEDGEPKTSWYLSDGMGRFVMGRDGKPIVVDISPQTDLNELDFPIGVFDWINHNGMTSESENRINPVDKNGQLGFGNGTVVQGYLELGNVDLANELSKVIESQRSFQMMLRMVTTSDEIETTVNNLR